MKIEKTKQKIAAAASGDNDFINVDDKNLPGCSNKIQPPTDSKQFAEWLQEYKKKVCKNEIIKKYIYIIIVSFFSEIRYLGRQIGS